MLADVHALTWTLQARPDRVAYAKLASVSAFSLSSEARRRIDSVLVDKVVEFSCGFVAVS